MILGLTGSFGSGKTTVSDMLEEKGACVIDADDISHQVTKPGSEGLEQIKKVFGNDFIKSDGSLDRKKMALHVFSNEQALRKLENIIHPLVEKRMMKKIEENRGHPLIVLTIPLMFEAGFEKMADKTVTVTVSPETRIERIRSSRNMSRQDIERRLENQLPQEEKSKRSDFIINNNGSLEETKRQLDGLISKLNIKGMKNAE